MTRMLVVDDNEEDLYLLRLLLQENGYQVDTATNGLEALEKARAERPDMIIADILMPVMDGFTLCREWKKDERLKEIPFVFYTATYTDPKDEEFALSLGAERFIVKPVEPDVLVGLLREVISEAEEGRLVAPREPIEEEPVFLKEYSERLVRKLEDKMLQLEEANRALERELTERKRAEEQVQASLREKTVLLQEIHHRVKNNLAIVSSLLEWQSETIEDERARAAFQDSQDRVYSMARIHESLYRSQDLARVDMVEYIEGLVDYLRQSYGTYAIPLEIEAADVALDIDTALPCGLIINELVSNAMKHAFPTGQSGGEIYIALRSDEGQVELMVSDNGVGLPADVDLEDPKSLGLTLVNLLVQQLGGTLEVDRDEGTTFRLTFAVSEERSQDNDGQGSCRRNTDFGH